MEPVVRRFKQSDLQRAIRGALKEGMLIVAASIRPDGSIELQFDSVHAPTLKNEWDDEA